MKRIIVNASSIVNGGGKTLLLDLLNYSLEIGEKFIYFVDPRLEIPNKFKSNENIVFIMLPKYLVARYFVDLKIRKIARKGDRVIYLNNLPQIFDLPCKTIMFLQNKYYVSNSPLKGFSLKSIVRIKIEKLMFKYFGKNSEKIVVQTPSMKKDIISINKKFDDRVEVFPFCSGFQRKRAIETKAIDDLSSKKFIYISSGEPHKNHWKLIKAFKILKEQGLNPSLNLTIRAGDFNSTKGIDDYITEHNLNINLLGRVPKDKVVELYKECDALIFPSKLESFGFPLLEAQMYNVPIVAGEIDFVRDIVNPDETFDPDSEVSIARAIKRFCKIRNEELIINSPKDFLDYCLDV